MVRFCYFKSVDVYLFPTKKGFLDDGNTDYLQDKLDESEQKEKDLYYKVFLKTLFFQRFGRREEDREDTVNQLIGEIKYLNGGLFLPHAIEVKYEDKINIADDSPPYCLCWVEERNPTYLFSIILLVLIY